MGKSREKQAMREICVIGSGVVGVTTAWYLAEAGLQVRLLDRAATVASGASFQNGGQLSYRYVSPLADAGVPIKAFKWLTEADGPLRFRPTADTAQWRWLAQFLMRCNSVANRETTAKLLRLGAYSRAQMEKLIAGQALPDFNLRQPGKLVIYRSQSALNNATRKLAATDTQQVLNALQCLELEPVLANLQGRFSGGIYTHDEAVADCHGFCQSLYTRLAEHANFRGSIVDEALAFEQSPHNELSLLTHNGYVEADAFVLAAGVGSVKLAAGLGLHLPIYPLKGYSLSAPIEAGHVALNASITDFERKVLYARIGDTLRVAAMADLVGNDANIDPARIDSLLRIAKADMPLAGNYDKATPWAGLRPATPHGAPIVGPSGHPQLWYNLGHGPLGFTFAAGTACLLAQMMTADTHLSVGNVDSTADDLLKQNWG